MRELWQLWHRHAISPRSLKVCFVRDATRQSGHMRTAPDGVRLFLILSRHSLWILRRTQRESACGGGCLAPKHAPVWWLCGGEEAHGGDGFAPVPALEHVEGDDAIPSREHVEAYGTIGLEHALVLQLPAAGEHAAPAQERDDIMRREHPAAFFAARSHGEPAFPARRRSNPAGVSNKRCKVAQAESNGVCRHEVQGRPGRPYAWAGTPRSAGSAASAPRTSACTWSCMSASSGHTTIVTPHERTAGSWKQRDLPPPVGSSTKTSLSSRMSRTMSRCAVRKDAWPKMCRLAASTS